MKYRGPIIAVTTAIVSLPLLVGMNAVPKAGLADAAVQGSVAAHHVEARPNSLALVAGAATGKTGTVRILDNSHTTGADPVKSADAAASTDSSSSAQKSTDASTPVIGDQITVPDIRQPRQRNLSGDHRPGQTDRHAGDPHLERAAGRLDAEHRAGRHRRSRVAAPDGQHLPGRHARPQHVELREWRHACQPQGGGDPSRRGVHHPVQRVRSGRQHRQHRPARRGDRHDRTGDHREGRRLRRERHLQRGSQLQADGPGRRRGGLRHRQWGHLRPDEQQVVGPERGQLPRRPG